MSEYLAKYTGTAREYSLGGTGKTYTFSKEILIHANDDPSARNGAKEKKLEIEKNLLEPKISLVRLIEPRYLRLD